MPEPVWKPHPDFPMYLISDTGLVKSTHGRGRGKGRGTAGEYVSPWLNRSGGTYQRSYVSLADGRGTRVNRTVARLVAETFIGPKPTATSVLRHLDGNPLNNCVENLAWGTQRENAADAAAHGTRARGETNGRARLTVQQVREIFLANGFHADIAAHYGVSSAHVCGIKSRTFWAHETKGLGEPGSSPYGTQDRQRHRRQYTDEQIRAVFVDPRPATVLAAETGMSQTQINRIRRRECWANLTADLTRH